MAPRTRSSGKSEIYLAGAATVLNAPPDITESAGVTIKTTQPDILLRHSISDEELTMLQKSKSDKAWEMTLAALGAAAGSAPQVARDLYAAFWAKSSPLDGASVIGLLIFGGACITALSTWVLSQGQQSEADTLAGAIRERTKASFEVIPHQKGKI
jgi:hypothetical protein